MKASDSTTTIQELKQLMAKFSDDRQWHKHHTPKNLAISIALEAAELMENFQWGEYDAKDKQSIADELADVLIYCLCLANRLEIDVSSTYKAKLAAAAKKYPVEVFAADGKLDGYQEIKQAYRKDRQ